MMDQANMAVHSLTMPAPGKYNLSYELKSILQDCGQLCNTSRQGSPGPYFDHILAPIDCNAILKNEYVDRGHGLPLAPETIPIELMNEFSMNNRIPVRYWHLNSQYLGKKASSPVWTEKAIEDWIIQAKEGKLKGNYGEKETNALRDGLKHAPGIKDGRVLVIGSEIPWVEACVLEAGAREVVTLEYGSIISEHPKVKTMVPFVFRMRYLNNTLGTFDAIVTFSSIEHSGLGRYGDALNPWGDIIAIARAWCVTKPGGSLTIVPKPRTRLKRTIAEHRTTSSESSDGSSDDSVDYFDVDYVLERTVDSEFTFTDEPAVDETEPAQDASIPSGDAQPGENQGPEMETAAGSASDIDEDANPQEDTPKEEDEQPQEPDTSPVPVRRSGRDRRPPLISSGLYDIAAIGTTSFGHTCLHGSFEANS
ncbi:unnamed protein product [Mytilus coruscus]|uniref:Uncharacterized protein n=1 Tax=Mytilus coruscus TaxID=42192 RepID=A0A6J8BMB9_MYTCO|nr:unnamed protein product [Mytilus coruscus]